MQTLKHVFLFGFVFATLALLVALVPMNVSSAPALQDTVVPDVTVVVTSPVGGYPVPVTGGPTMSPILVIGLLVLIGIAIVVVALALTNTSRSDDLPPRV
jgi:hypothetical protein